MLAIILILAAAAVAGVLWLYRSDLERAHRNVLHGSQIVTTALGPIEVAQREGGVPVLSIHGAGGGWDQGLENVVDFLGGGFDVIAPSRFGYLRTPVPADASVAAQADAHAALLTKLKISEAIVVGVSAGARSAVEFVIRHPAMAMALILVVPGTYSPKSVVSVPADRGSRFVLAFVQAGADFFWWILRKFAPSLLVRFVGVPPELLRKLSAADRRRVMRIVEAIQPLSLRMKGIEIDGTPPAEPAFDRIKVPTLIFSARDDLYNSAPAASFAANRVSAAELMLFETGGHLLAGHGSEVREAVGHFLSHVSAGQGIPASAH